MAIVWVGTNFSARSGIWTGIEFPGITHVPSQNLADTGYNADPNDHFPFKGTSLLLCPKVCYDLFHLSLTVKSVFSTVFNWL